MKINVIVIDLALWLLSVKITSSIDETTTISVLAGKPLIIKCRQPKLENIVDTKLQWSKDMFGLESNTLAEVYKNRISVSHSESSGIFDLNFKSTESDDQGLFGCHIDITLKDGKTVNIVEKTYLKIIVPPSNLKMSLKISKSNNSNIIWSPNEKIIWGLENKMLTLQCNDKASQPPPKIQWTMTTDSTTFQITTLQGNQSAILKLSKRIHNSIVTCNIKNKDDYPEAELPSINYTIRVLYLHKPFISHDESKFQSHIKEGDLATFTCNSETPKDSNTYFSWYIRYLNPIQSDHYLVNDSTSNIITLKMSQSHHKGRLHCLLKNKLQINECYEQINKYCELKLMKDLEDTQPFNILYPPKILIPFENITVTNLGEWITLNCNVDSNPSVTIKWYKTQIGTTKNSRSINWYHQTKISNLIESLRIENIVISGSYHKFQVLNDQDFDIYICEAKSVMFESAYKYVIVAKKEEISIKPDRRVIKISEGGSASLMCLIEGWPKPHSQIIKWHHSDSQIPLIFSERMYVVNRNQLMAIESKLYFKNVINADYGSYNCTVSMSGKSISKRIDLQPIKDPLIIFIIIGLIGILFVIITVIIIACISRKLYEYKKIKNEKVKCNEYGPPIPASILTTPTLDSSMDNEVLYNRLNSLQSFHTPNNYNESINITPNRCFIFNNKHQILRNPSNESRNGPDDMLNSKVNGSNRSWDSGVGHDDSNYRNGQIVSNPRGSRCISPFSTMASSNNSIGPTNLLNQSNIRYWQPPIPTQMLNQTNIESDQTSNFNGSVHSSYNPSSIDGSGPLIASQGNQSFVCIPIEEYQQHIRLLQDSRGEPSINSLSSSTFSPNTAVSTFNNNFKVFNGDLTPTENSVKSISISSKT